MKPFDIASIAEESIRERYHRLEKRGGSVAHAIREGFGPARGGIELQFVEDAVFNASAAALGRDYRIEIAGPVPLLMVVLFDKLLSDPRLMPWLAAESEEDAIYDVPFIVDPVDFSERRDWSVALNGVRSLAASILADIASTFILLHEAGHVICGHVDALHTDGPHRLTELFVEEGRTAEERDRGLAWEADADSVAATLLLDYLDELATTSRSHPDAALIFGREGQTVEHILALAIVAMFAMFAYLRGARYALGLASSHPHPFVRAYFVKDMLIMAARMRWPLDLDALATLMDERLDEMLLALEAIGLSDNARFDDDYLEETNAELDRLVALRAQYRPSASAWFPWDDVDFRDSAGS